MHVTDTRGYYIRDALVFVRSTPLVTTAPPETATETSGWVTLTTTPRLDFPLKKGFAVQFFVRARKAGENLLAGVSSRRLVTGLDVAAGLIGDSYAAARERAAHKQGRAGVPRHAGPSRAPERLRRRADRGTDRGVQPGRRTPAPSSSPARARASAPAPTWSGNARRSTSRTTRTSRTPCACTRCARRSTRAPLR